MHLFCNIKCRGVHPIYRIDISINKVYKGDTKHENSYRLLVFWLILKGDYNESENFIYLPSACLLERR